MNVQCYCHHIKDRNQDTQARIGIGIALKRHALALPNMGIISNVNQLVINLLAKQVLKIVTGSKNSNYSSTCFRLILAHIRSSRVVSDWFWVRSLKMRPAKLNTRSAEAEVAGTAKNCCAIRAK